MAEKRLWDSLLRRWHATFIAVTRGPLISLLWAPRHGSSLPQRSHPPQPPPPFPPISYDTLCMCSLTAVYINQYIYQTAAAYCVCRFEWAKDTKGVSMLCKKGPSSSFPSLLCPCSLPLVFLHTFVPLSSLLANPLLVLQSHTDIKITQWDPTADTTLTATSRLHLLSVEDQWSGHFHIVLAASTSLLFRSWQPQCCCFLICGVWGVSIILLVFFISKMRGGGVCESCFSSFRHNKAHPMASCPPLSPSVSRTPPLPSPPPCPVCLCLCALCEPLSLLITITVHPPPTTPKLVNTTQSFCVL